jgi:GTP-binding protein EngB required for normal cell division
MASVALQSKEHRDLLDIIDKLRSKGISRYVDLPEIIVCGEQSAGKSSILEAISGMSFPTKDNLCTRFATELVLRRDTTPAVSVSINPGPERSADERDRLSRFQFELGITNPNLGSIVERAKEAMGLNDTKVFSTDALRVELCGPTQPHLTIVDLPGLFRAGNSDQSMDDAATVRKMVHSYMGRPRSIILAVVSAKSDFALQEVTEFARELDPKGTRTLGLITKPDTLDPGSDSEAAYLKLAQNKDVVFRLGWHVLKNRSYQMREASSAERDNAEKDFFAKGVWVSMEPKHLGVNTLKTRLSNVLKDQILHQLPSLLYDVESGIAECQSRLERLGTPRGAFEQQRRYLLRVSQKFSVLMKAAVDGLYNDPFFGSAKIEVEYQKRLRAVIQNTLTEFEEDMRLNGQTRLIVESPTKGRVLNSGKISRLDYTNEVKDLMRRGRGCELPGTFNPLVIGQLFNEQCQPWRDITVRTKDIILQGVYQTTRSILNHIAVDETADGIFRLINQGIDTLKNDVEQKVTELLEPHYNGHPITYNHYLIENVQKAQSERRRRSLEETLKKFFNSENLQRECTHSMLPINLLTLLETRTEVDMELHASNLAVDFMQAYYKVSEPRVLCLVFREGLPK